jgi:hypothetical protein
MRSSSGFSIYSTTNGALWLHHHLNETGPAVLPTLALAHAVYRQQQARPAASEDQVVPGGKLAVDVLGFFTPEK